MQQRGFFISLEGPDGCGKTTQAALLRDRLSALGYECWLTREPGGTRLGDSIREMLLSLEHLSVSPRAEMLLFAASRAQHVDEQILPRLNKGMIVITDRYIDSSLVYQGIGLGLGVETVWDVNLVATANLLPDITVVLELNAAICSERLEEKLQRNNCSRDKIESRDMVYHKMVSEGYEQLKQRFPERVLSVDARQDPGKITDIILTRIIDILSIDEKGGRPL